MTWQFFAASELKTLDLGEPTFLVAPLMPLRGIAMLHGPKTAGKTQLALALSAAIANNSLFLGEYRCWQGPVVYVEVDMTLGILQERVRLFPGIDKLHFLHGEPFNVLEAAQRPPAAFERARALEPVLVVVDSLRKSHTLDEIESSTPTFVYTAWRRLFPSAAFLFLHHDRKKPTNPQAYLHKNEAHRGTGAWLDDIDLGMQLDRLRQAEDGVHRCLLTFSKCRTTEEPSPIALRMNDETLDLVPEKLTARHQLMAWQARQNGATPEAARAWLLDNKICGRSMAYRLVSEVLSTL